VSKNPQLLIHKPLSAIQSNQKKMTAIELLKAIVKRTNGFGCTTFSIKKENQIVFGRNFDFMIDFGHIIINKRNVSKTALVPLSEKQFSWTSRFGSISFNQLGREFPFGGMNESGLVIEQLWLNSTKYPQPDNRYGISVLQWIQYQLDTAKSIDDIIKSDATLRIIDDAGANLHFFITDKKGESASIEFINGKMEVAYKEKLPITVLTNNSYQESLRSLTDSNKEEVSQNPFTSNSLFRFAETVKKMKEVNQTTSNLIAYSFEVLDVVKQENFTQWSIVYDIQNQEIHFKTKSNTTRKVIRLADFDFSSKTNCLISDMKNVKFEEYSYVNNLTLINKVFDSLDMLRGVPIEVRKISAKYPDSTIFNDKKADNKVISNSNFSDKNNSINNKTKV